MDATFITLSAENRAAIAALVGSLSVYFSINRDDSSEMAIFGMVGLVMLAYAASQMFT